MATKKRAIRLTPKFGSPFFSRKAVPIAAATMMMQIGIRKTRTQTSPCVLSE